MYNDSIVKINKGEMKRLHDDPMNTQRAVSLINHIPH